ncbi:MAG: hypothetical protein Q4E24_04120 [bacterium]|nr:hypothetical protein [bacterium]
MSDAEKKMLIREAKMQTEALMRLGIWRRAALSLMALGILLSFWSFVIQIHILAGIFGILVAVLAGWASFLITVGTKNGKKNVEKILKAVTD